ncbi:serine/threonine-protein kinase AFC2 [Tanacetum coccineum]|uniref:Serine/threonine-protein kinase AFC2 n=1 Tax=Tanacetum coccineum TaxID=301880 RepID=A0ABQ4WGA4_9ASTR
MRVEEAIASPLGSCPQGKGEWEGHAASRLSHYRASKAKAIMGQSEDRTYVESIKARNSQMVIEAIMYTRGSLGPIGFLAGIACSGNLGEADGGTAIRPRRYASVYGEGPPMGVPGPGEYRGRPRVVKGGFLERAGVAAVSPGTAGQSADKYEAYNFEYMEQGARERGHGWSYPCDIWSVGCILVELCSGEALFQIHENLEHLAIKEMVLGPLPSHMLKKAE